MIDGTNYKTAYASGMKEEVGLFDRLTSLITQFTDTILSCLVAQHDRKRTQLPGHLLSNRLRHLPLTVSDHLDQSPAELVVAFDGDGLGSHDR
jgi:hypothetical protein